MGPPGLTEIPGVGWSFCWAEVVSSPGGHLDSSCSWGWTEDLVVLCGIMWLLSPWALYGRDWWCFGFIARCIWGRPHAIYYLLVQLLLNLNFLNSPKRIHVAPKWMTEILLELLIQRQDLGKNLVGMIVGNSTLIILTCSSDLGYSFTVVHCSLETWRVLPSSLLTLLAETLLQLKNFASPFFPFGV